LQCNCKVKRARILAKFYYVLPLTVEETTSAASTTETLQLSGPLAGRRRRPLFSTEARKPGTLFTRTRTGSSSTEPDKTTERARTRIKLAGGGSTTTAAAATTTTEVSSTEETLPEEVAEEEEEEELHHETENVIETSAETEKPRESLVERFKGLRRAQRPQQQRPSSSTTSAR
jgi:hypothetical protein